MKRTPLYDVHVRSGGKMIDFGGWELPVQYAGIIEEHNRVRSAAGLFDVSHMGEITVQGPGAEAFIQRMVTNDISRGEDLQIIYSPMCYPDGGVVDDLLVYRYNREDYLLVVNAANKDKDYAWLLEHLDGATDRAGGPGEYAESKNTPGGAVRIADVSEAYAQLAIQGPKAQEILQKLTSEPLDNIGFYRFRAGVDVGGITAIVSRTGYTGEDGFELYLPVENAVFMWEKLIEAGAGEGLAPAGLGARDTLRFEAALPLYGHELSADISPLEAGLGKFVKLAKDDFVGKAALSAQVERGIPRKLAGFEMVDRGIPRNGYEVWSGEDKIGFVTTGSFSPSLGKNIGLAMVQAEYAQPETGFNIIIRERPLKVVAVKIPFYQKKYKK